MSEKKIRPQDKWNEKVGLKSKSYKLREELTNCYADACQKEAVSQAGQLSRMMQAFINRDAIVSEYKSLHGHMVDKNQQYDILIQMLKEIVTESGQESVKDKADECIALAMELKSNNIEDCKKLYNFYNEKFVAVAK